MLVNILIIFFIILISYQIILATQMIEGLTNNQYQDYDTTNPQNALILAQKNAGNIEYIKDQIGNIPGMTQQIQDLSGNVASLQEQVNDLVSTQQSYVNQVTGGTTPDISGTTSDSSGTTSDSSGTTSDTTDTA